MPNTKFEAPTWDQVYGMLLELAGKVKRSGFKPEVIVGVSRGGWPPARIMSDLLQNDNLANMKVVFYKDIGVRNKRPVITQPVTAPVRGRKVLVVDDVSDSGHSLKVVSSHLSRKGARLVKVCTLYLKPRSIFVPNFYAKQTRKWVIFPWERLEAVRLIAKKHRKKRDQVAFVVNELRGSGLEPQMVRVLLRMSSDGKD